MTSESDFLTQVSLLPVATKQLKLFNAQTQMVEAFNPPNPTDVKIYCCGPTVYEVPHLGHARTYVFFDVLRRILRDYLGYGVRSVMNITDLDKKIVDKGGVEITRRYEEVFFVTMKWLNVERPDFVPRVTECLDIVFDASKTCLTKKYAYYSQNFETTYFSTKQYLEKYGRVFPQSEVRDDGHRKEASLETNTKWDSRDFALWKHEKNWKDAVGKEYTGMPGWHTECAAIAYSYFPNYIDILLGGIDLQFPHHENKLAIDRVCHDRPVDEKWARFCLYTGHLHIEGKKMSKSLKNFTTVAELLDEGHTPLALRYMLMKRPYYKPYHYCKDEMKRAEKSYQQFMHNLQRLKQMVSEAKSDDTKMNGCEDDILFTEEESMVSFKQSIDYYLMNNLNVPDALERVEQYVKWISKSDSRKFPFEWLSHTYKYIVWLVDTCFGLRSTDSKDEPNDLYSTLSDFRHEVREWALKNNKDESSDYLLMLCDYVREEANKMGYVIEDASKISTI